MTGERNCNRRDEGVYTSSGIILACLRLTTAESYKAESEDFSIGLPSPTGAPDGVRECAVRVN